MSDKPSTWSNILFVLLMTILCGFAGLFISRFFIPKSAGLAGGATVLFYGIIGLIIGLVVSLILKKFIPKKLMRNINILLCLLGLGCAIWLTSKVLENKERNDAERIENETFNKPTKKKETTEPIKEVEPDSQKKPYGLGMAKPSFTEMKTLHFYGNSDESLLSSPIDSVSFGKSKHGDVEITSAPPWLVPAHLKLDYQIFYFKVLRQTKNYFQIVGNEKTSHKTWIRKSDVIFQSWPDFLLQVFAVEPKNWENNPIRIKPLSHASPIQKISEDAVLNPLSIDGEWIEVKVLNDNYEEVARGWLRWRTNDALTIDYSLLS